MHSKEDLDDLCGDLFAIRVIAQCTGIPTSVRKQLRGSLKALLYKSSRYQEVAELEISQNRKPKVATTTNAEKAPAKSDEEVSAKSTPASANPKSSSPTPKLSDTKEAAENVEMEVDSEADTNKSGKDVKNGVEAMETDKTPLGDRKDNSGNSASKSVVSTAEKAENDAEHTAKKVTEKTDKDVTEEKEKKIDEETKKSTPTKNQPDAEETAASGSQGGASTTATAVEQSKSIQKKSTEVRLYEEHEKRIKLLLTMETYIKSILVLMQRDECSTSPTPATTGGGDESETTADVSEAACKRGTSIAVAPTTPSPSSGSAGNKTDSTPDKSEEKTLRCEEQNDAKAGDSSDSHNSPTKLHTSKASDKEESDVATNANPIATTQPTTTMTPTPTISAATAAALHSQQI